jgi:lipoprotein-releasing system permease protein
VLPILRVFGSDAFIALRYLYRRRHSKVVLFMTIASFLFAVAVQVAFFKFGYANLGASLTVPSVLLFLLFLLLNFFSVFTTVSMVGVVLGVTALSVALSVTSGFQESFRNKVLGVNSHVLILKYGLDFSEYRDVQKKVEAVPHVKAAAPFVLNEMMIARGSALSGVLIKGIDTAESPRVIDIADRLDAPAKIADLAVPLAPNDGGKPLPEIFVGRELQKRLKAKIGDRVRVVSPKADLDPAAQGVAPSAKEFRLAGVFYSGFDEYDRRLAYVNLPEAQAFYQAGDVVTGVEMKVDDITRAQDIAKDIKATLGGSPYRVIDWEELNHNLFTALRMQKVAIVIILTLIILVAAFNIVAAMTMIVTQKTKEIAILKAMGMRSGVVGRVFIIGGLVIGTIGTACGIAFGMLVCTVVRHYGYHLDPKIYLIDELPVRVEPLELMLIVGITLTISLVATIYPSLKAASMHPVDGLRYE